MIVLEKHSITAKQDRVTANSHQFSLTLILVQSGLYSLKCVQHTVWEVYTRKSIEDFRIVLESLQDCK